MKLGWACTYHLGEQGMTQIWEWELSLAWTDHGHGIYWVKRKTKLNHGS